MAISKKRRHPCGKHKATSKNWDSYEFKYLQPDGIEVWYCKECSERNRKLIALYDSRKKKECDEAEQKYLRKWREFYDKQEARKKDMHENLWDCVVQSALNKGMGRGSQYVPFPIEVLQLKRATMKLDRLIKKKKTIINDKNKIDKENKRLHRKSPQYLYGGYKNPLLVCITHGNLYHDKVNRSGKDDKGKYIYTCKRCDRKQQIKI